MSDANEESGASRSRRHAARIGATAAALVAAIALAPPATAAEPKNQACLGHDVRTYADMGVGFGGFVSGLSEGGVGTEIQAHLAGLVSDESVPNTCNDE